MQHTVPAARALPSALVRPLLGITGPVPSKTTFVALQGPEDMKRPLYKYVTLAESVRVILHPQYKHKRVQIRHRKTPIRPA
jgi:hypothetical protein